MVRKIVRIDEERCTGCGACAEACHEGAIGMVRGKARLLRDDYCDGMGDCLPECPAGAISFEIREAAAYDSEAVAKHMKAREAAPKAAGCPGSFVRDMRQGCGQEAAESRLGNWPVQIKLAPVRAPYFDGAELLIAADCTAYAYAGVHREFMAGRVTLIGCSKLDGVDYSQKLREIFVQNDIRGVTLLRMEVPCCGGLEMAARRAIQESGRDVPMRMVTVSVRGELL